MNKIFSISLLLLLALPVFSQTESQVEQKSNRFRLHFSQSISDLDPDFRQNRGELSSFAHFIEQLGSNPSTTLTSIELSSFTSPEGGRHYNNELSEKRNGSVYQYLVDEMNIPDTLITQNPKAADWDGMYSYVLNSDMKYRDTVLYIIKNVPEETWARVNSGDRWLTMTDSRNRHLMSLRYGRVYNEMLDSIYPKLRYSEIVVHYTQEILIEKPVEEEPTPQPQVIAPIEQDTIPQEPQVEELVESESCEKKPLPIALKTNLLYDIALTPNIEIEVPIGQRWSIGAEWIFPWWITKDNAYALQVLSGQVEGRYWFGDRDDRLQLTGWFAGLYAGGGLYDLQWKNNGYQGEFFIAAGASGGYAHTINKSGSLRMEYSLGVGYLKTNYRYYEGRENNEFLVWQRDGNYTWLGPTKLEVSLVWMFNLRGAK